MNSALPIQRLIDELERLPNVGFKSAQRMAYWLLNADRETALRLAQAIVDVKDSVHFCAECFNYAEDELCELCANPTRNRAIICVVTEPSDIPPIERTGAFDGLYHVLGGVLAPAQGTGPDDLHIKELLARCSSSTVEEVILATDLDVLGEATAAYLARLIRPLGIKVSRLRVGIPSGSEVEYASEVDLARAIEDRKDIS